MVLTLGVPFATAKIYPDDFLVPGQTMSSSSSSMSSSSWSNTSDTSGTPFFFASDIPSGKLTRAQFVDALATRLYDSEQHDNCFVDLIISNTVDYSLLFTDVPLTAPVATSLCVAMNNGFMKGYSDGYFRSSKLITAAEAAAALTKISGIAHRDSNHMQKGEAWYARFMEAVRSMDREFTLRPGDMVTGAQLKHTLCVLKRGTPAVDPLGEFNDC